MKSPVFARAAGAAAALLLATVALAQPAAAATSVTPVPIAPNVVRFDYVLDSDATVSATTPFLTSTGEPSGCTRAVAGNKPYTTATFSVSQSGIYYLTDARAEGSFLPQQYQSAGRSGVADGFAAIYSGALASNDLDASCVVATDDTRRPAQLQAGVTYTIALASLADRPASGQSYSMLVDGPGVVTVGEAELTAERALAACQEGSDVPAGYTLREGTAKSETLTGTAGNDVIRGLGGNDTIRGLGGDDILCGGEGQDTLDGGDGADFVFGGAGQDTLNGAAGDDVLDGGVGQDTLNGGAGDDELRGGAGNDVHDGGAGFDTAIDVEGTNTFRAVESRGEPAPTPTATTTAAR